MACLPAVAIAGTKNLTDRVSKERIIHFPADRSLGQLMVQDAGTKRQIESFYYWITNEYTEWQLLGKATGDVIVPAGKRLALSVSQSGWKDLSPLSKLGPDDLYMLSIYGPYSRGRKPDNRCMPHIAHLRGLKVLKLENTSISAGGLKLLGNLGSLERLSFSKRLTDAGLAEVARLPSLKGLILKENRLTNVGLAHLAQLTSLKELVLDGERMNNAALAHLARLPSLRYLYLHGENFTDTGMTQLKNIPSLRILHFGHLTQLTDAALVHLSEIPGLERLSFHWNGNITDAGIVHLKKLRSLKMLDISHSQVTDEGLAHLAKIKSLEYLDLPSARVTSKGTDYPITDKGLAHLVQLERLWHLKVGTRSSGNPVTDEGLRFISRLLLLEELSIGGRSISNSGMEHITKLTNLKDLMLFGCPNLGNAGLEILTEIKSLKKLSVNYTNVTVSGLTRLNALPNLTNLYAHDIRRGNSVLDVSGLTKLEKLSLSFKSRSTDSFTDVDLMCLAKLKSLESLLIYPNNFTDAGMAHIAELTELERLRIGGPDLTDDALRYLAGLPRLNSLTISDGNITDEGLRQLETLEALRYLNITSRHRFSAAAIRRLRQNLPNLRTFRTQLKDTSPRRTNRRR